MLEVDEVTFVDELSPVRESYKYYTCIQGQKFDTAESLGMSEEFCGKCKNRSICLSETKIIRK